MRGVALLYLLIASCAPDYGHSAFRCDAEHGCPAGQACHSGRCRRGPPTGDGVVCGTAVCDLTQQCCIDGRNLPRCIAAGDICPGDAALCDGVEDCPMDDRCCADGDLLFCDRSCKDHACRDGADCPSTAPNCCNATGLAWGECSEGSC